MKLIPLNTRFKKCKNYGKYFAKVDDEVYDYLMQWSWQAHYDGSNWYAVRNVTNPVTKKRGRIFMHREIMGCVFGDGKEVDHILGDGLNNQKTNLRIGTHQQNTFNRKKKEGTTSKYRGVCWHKRDEHWRAQIRFNKKHKVLGCFNNEHEAALAYNTAAISLFGEFAKLNVITQPPAEEAEGLFQASSPL